VSAHAEDCLTTHLHHRTFCGLCKVADSSLAGDRTRHRLHGCLQHHSNRSRGPVRLSAAEDALRVPPDSNRSLQRAKQHRMARLQPLPQVHLLMRAVGAACVNPAMNAAVVLLTGRSPLGQVRGELPCQFRLHQQQPCREVAHRQCGFRYRWCRFRSPDASPAAPAAPAGSQQSYCTSRNCCHQAARSDRPRSECPSLWCVSATCSGAFQQR
jgi:hypothetical protein